MSLMSRRRARGEREVEPVPPSWWAQVTGCQVIVHPTAKGANSLRGTVSGVLDDGVVLDHVTMLGEDGPDTALAGTSWIPRENVLFVQTVPRTEEA